ncbi:tripartite tricarboxylate transporter substrate binding protein [Variovorax sp. efr-133-TYG-130]|uniref:Bug family tripartite tricarboxylate transporter substrate binding protein n=1 Tax=Variovorax sp. efr-133-TYG-130 TaxID=3040327 RepID=UPI002553054F|nr:tripartite tricarboxylate transporter substrate binding protein [Variovorax sp. efr-133-TYG-130]
MKKTMMTTIASRAVAALIPLLALAAPFSTSAQTFPDRSIKLSVGFPPGTGPDLLARVVGQKVGELVKQPLIIDNRPGAGGQIASQVVAKSPADGYNLLLAEAGSVSIAPAAFTKLAYDPARELVAVAELAWADFVLVVPPSSPYKTLAELVADNKGKANPLNFATFGAGSPGHFGAVEFGLQAGVKVEPIHFRNTGDAVTAIIAGDVSGAWVSTAVASAQIKGGKMRALAITAKSRSPLLPDVPTTGEAGMPKLNFSSWLGVLAPAGTPVAILDLLNRNFLLAVQSPEVKQKLIEAGFTVTGAGRDETDRMLKEQAVRWGGIVKASGFRGD